MLAAWLLPAACSSPSPKEHITMSTSATEPRRFPLPPGTMTRDEHFRGLLSHIEREAHDLTSRLDWLCKEYGQDPVDALRWVMRGMPDAINWGATAFFAIWNDDENFQALIDADTNHTDPLPAG
jgi:hypothetical protein